MSSAGGSSSRCAANEGAQWDLSPRKLAPTPRTGHKAFPQGMVLKPSVCKPRASSPGLTALSLFTRFVPVPRLGPPGFRFAWAKPPALGPQLASFSCFQLAAAPLPSDWMASVHRFSHEPYSHGAHSPERRQLHRWVPPVRDVPQGSLKMLRGQLCRVHLECFPEGGLWRPGAGRWEAGRREGHFWLQGAACAKVLRLLDAFPPGWALPTLSPWDRLPGFLAQEPSFSHGGMHALWVHSGIPRLHPGPDCGCGRGWGRSESRRECIWGIPHPYFPHGAEVVGSKGLGLRELTQGPSFLCPLTPDSVGSVSPATCFWVRIRLEHRAPLPVSPPPTRAD